MGEARPSTARTVLRLVTIVASLPYLLIKTAWISGSRIGIPQHSSLREDGGSLIAVNSLTVVMEAAVIALAFLLTRPWGRRVPAWTLALPMWFATGLIAPIVVVFPVQTLVAALNGDATRADTGANELLAPWVWSVVYGGFIIQGVCLGTLFALYARDRWGHLWRGRVGDLAGSPSLSAQRIAATAAAMLTVLPVVMHLLWAAGADAGLNASRIAARDTDFRLTEAGFALLAMAAVTGVLLVGFRRGRRLPLAASLGLAWLGSGALGCWGGWMMLTALSATADDPAAPTPLMNLTYSVQMIVGTLIATAGAYFFAQRSTDHELQEYGRAT